MALHKLYHDKPADLWHDGYPVGNGRLGAMVRGTTNVERLWVNEDSVWYGGPQDRVNPAARANLDLVRDLIDKQDIPKAEEVMLRTFTASPQALRHYEPLGDVLVSFGHGVDPPGAYRHMGGIPVFDNQAFSGTKDSVPEAYRRELDLSTGVTSVDYDYQGAHYRREVFSSSVDEVLCMRVSSDQDLQFAVTLDRGDDPDWDRKLNKTFDSLVPIDCGHLLSGATGGKKGVEFAMGYRVILEGHGDIVSDGIDSKITAQGSVVILVAGETTFRHLDADAAVLDRLGLARSKSWSDLLSAHVSNSQAYTIE